jgi:membrane protease YdiL (CAAX protease family)
VFRTLLYTSGHATFFLVLELIVYIISSLLLLYLLKQDRGFELPKISLSHFVFCISGALLGIGIGIFQAWLHQSLKPIHLGDFSGQFITYFFYSLSVPVIMEEPLFRGFLWGYLREKGFQETPIWIIQACIFSLIHVTKWHSLPLLVEAFAFGLIIGSIVRFTRSLAPAMTFHAAVNGIMFAFFYASP